MIHTDKVVVVEGKYDEIKLASIIDATIIKTDGFGIFKDYQKQQLLKTLAKKRGIIVLTDSDSAGFMIRNFIGSTIPEDKIVNVYIPDVYGKERRKTQASAEGKLGVEGIDNEIIRQAFAKVGMLDDNSSDDLRMNSLSSTTQSITSLDLYEDGIIGGKNSKKKRLQLQKKLDLPERLSSKGLLKIINILISYDEYKNLIAQLEEP